MYQGTTPSITYTISGYDLTDKTVYVYFKSGSSLLVKTGDGVTVSYDSGTQKSTVVCTLSQEETLAMKKGSVKTQIRFIDSGGTALATSKASIRVNDVLQPVVISYSE